MPKLNYDKLPYKKFRQSISAPSEDSGGFYKCTKSSTPTIFREGGYDNYDYFGPTPRRHEPKDDVGNNEDELSL